MALRMASQLVRTSGALRRGNSGHHVDLLPRNTVALRSTTRRVVNPLGGHLLLYGRLAV